MGQVYTCPSCAKKIEDGQDWSLIEKQGDVEIRAHAGRCAMRAMHSFHKAPPKPDPRVVTPKKRPIDTTPAGPTGTATRMDGCFRWLAERRAGLSPRTQ